MHLIVGDVTVMAEIHWIDDFIVPIGLVAVEIPRLPTVAFKALGQACSLEVETNMMTHLSSGKRGSHWAERP